MAINLGSSNTSRYLSVPDSPVFSLPNNDWAGAGIVQLQSSVNPRYLFSTNGAGVANSFNLLIASTTNTLGVQVNTGALLETTGSPPPVGTWILAYACRRSSNLYCGWVSVGGTSVVESSSQAISSASDGSVMYIGGRSDLNTARFWQGSIAGVFFSNTYGITTADALEIAKGVPLLTHSIFKSLSFAVHFPTSNFSTTNDFISGSIITKNSTGYDVDAEEKYNFYAPPAVLVSQVSASTVLNASLVCISTITAVLNTGVQKGIRIILHDNSGVALANTSGLHVAWFDEDLPGSFLTIVHKANNETTDALGQLEINLNSATSLAVGGTGFLLVYWPNGIDHQDSLVFAGKITITNIA